MTSSVAALHELRLRLSSPELDQGHLFAGWPEHATEYSDAQLAFLHELNNLGKTYHGGVEQYVRNGKELLGSASSSSDTDHKEPGKDEGEADTLKALEMPSLIFTAPNLFERSEQLSQLEALGAEMIKRCVFVLVAGGLGERLGYSSIKVGLPVETATMRPYLEHYFAWAKAAAGPQVPFVLMTSNDTHDRTVKLIEELQPNMPNLRLLKQETVFCFANGAAHLAMSKDGALLRKPHGHGDVHSLIYAAKARADGRDEGTLVDAWLAMGCESIVFLQDTNAPATLTIPISLAVSKQQDLDMNFTCVPREPKEAIGLLCRTLRRLNGPAGSEYAWRTSIVEYNVFDSVATKLTKAGGDVAVEETGFSPFPGSINTLVYKLPSYATLLKASHGAVPEFINPKYADDTHTTFKKPARIESLMQDFALLLSEDQYRVGGTVFSRFTYQPVKNSLVDACKLAGQGMAPHCPTSGEEGLYELTRRRLAAVGVRIEQNGKGMTRNDVVVQGVLKAHLFPIVALDATATLGGADSGIGSLADLARVFPSPSKIRISANSTILIEGKVIVEDLELEGVVKLVGPSLGSADAPLIVRNLKVKNSPWTVRELTSADDVSEVDRIRGFLLEKPQPRVVDSSSKL